MTKNAKKIFEMLGVEPNEKFKIKEIEGKGYFFTEDLTLWSLEEEEVILSISVSLKDFLNEKYEIVKIPKKKKKLRDITPEENKEWARTHCKPNKLCKNCIFGRIICDEWISHKDLYSDKFLDQEIEVEENEITEEENFDVRR